ncbi:MAG: hypothetical protein ACLP50_07645 [Solirubrobacteraceae bacterium]
MTRLRPARAVQTPSWPIAQAVIDHDHHAVLSIPGSPDANLACESTQDARAQVTTRVAQYAADELGRPVRLNVREPGPQPDGTVYALTVTPAGQIHEHDGEVGPLPPPLPPAPAATTPPIHTEPLDAEPPAAREVPAQPPATPAPPRPARSPARPRASTQTPRARRARRSAPRTRSSTRRADAAATLSWRARAGVLVAILSVTAAVAATAIKASHNAATPPPHLTVAVVRDVSRAPAAIPPAAALPRARPHPVLAAHVLARRSSPRRHQQPKRPQHRLGPHVPAARATGSAGTPSRAGSAIPARGAPTPAVAPAASTQPAAPATASPASAASVHPVAPAPVAPVAPAPARPSCYPGDLRC